MLRLIILLFLCTLGNAVFGQTDKPVKDYLPTENLEMKKDANKAANRPDRKKYALIYVGTGDKIMYGNNCVIEATQKMGFQYIVEPTNLPGSKTRTGKFLNNLWVKTKLVFTRSPFWKLILKKRINQCREMSGDLVG